MIGRYFDELFNAGRVDLVETLLHPEYVNHSPGSPDLPSGREGVAIVVRVMCGAFPDLHIRIDDLVIGDDAVAVRLTMTGTHRGDLFGLAPTGRSVNVVQMNIEHFRERKIVAHHRITDDLTMVRQLGVVP